MKKLLSLFLIMLLALTLPACNANATDTATDPAASIAATPSDPFVPGDADGDGILSVLDATHIQRHLAGFATTVPQHIHAAMVSDGKELSVIDATLIQRKLAGLIHSFPVEGVLPTEQVTQPATEPSEPLLRIEVNGYTFLADFENNSSAEALREKLKTSALTIDMHDYGSFEKVGDLPFTLPRNDTSITTEPGDVILYQGSQLTIYYDVNTWSFTRVAKLRDADSSLRDKLGSGNVQVTLSLA